MYQQLNARAGRSIVRFGLVLALIVSGPVSLAAGGNRETGESDAAGREAPTGAAGTETEVGEDGAGVPPAGGEAAGAPRESGLVGARGERFAVAPATPSGALSSENRVEIDRLKRAIEDGEIPIDAILGLGAGEDPRVLWYLSDVLRFSRGQTVRAIYAAFAELTGVRLPGLRSSELRDHLFAWDIDAYPGYRDDKRDLYLLIDSRWEPFFADEDSAIDWRYVEWGGVLIDDRIDAGPGQPCFRCIPALDDPPVTDAAGGDWYPDDALIFGVVINGEARAYPRNMMEVHEMVNDTLGGRRFGMPYCTLCLAAQAYYTDNVEGFRPVLRTSGLLARSNKFMYDISTFSAIDTFTGEAISGPLYDAGVELEMITVVTSTWGEWKRAHPETTILTEDGGTPGRTYPADPLGGRDDNGPIFPVGAVDQRLPVQERVLGVIDADGTPVAFPVAAAAFALQRGEEVRWGSIEVILDGSGLRAIVGGEDAGSHEAFWFAWSQFRPDTVVWGR